MRQNPARRAWTPGNDANRRHPRDVSKSQSPHFTSDRPTAISTTSRPIPSLPFPAPRLWLPQDTARVLAIQHVPPRPPSEVNKTGKARQGKARQARQAGRQAAPATEPPTAAK
ncbi:hypothetical protein CSUB01_08633 [Colletotrichum sublineola]|uniref:Uncharacterized protein n=1 Tax=Colletotrichum sublineola TaxID=1173701 RepID=A0A066XFN8_COLSU|nr:hypothetical protein CSUB01_08633 [Colletotrichum sublineola]